MGDDSPPDNCSCGWGMSDRRKTLVDGDIFTGKLVRLETNPSCPVHGDD